MIVLFVLPLFFHFGAFEKTFLEKKPYPPVEDFNEKFQSGGVTGNEISGLSKKNCWFQGGFNNLQKVEISGNYKGSHGEIDWKSRNIDLKKWLYSQHGGTIFVLEMPNYNVL